MSKIVVDGVSKQFRLQKDRAHSLKELVTRRDRKSGADMFWALRDVSLEIEEGSMYALVGHNGSGKSTLLRCIAGIYNPTEGHVEVDGRISTLLELGAGFHPDLTGRENVYMNATILGMSKKEIDTKFDEIVDFAGIGQFIDSPVKLYSSGMYVRLGFSVAVHVRPDILIIDEVIAVGDEEFQRKCFDHLYGLRKQGVTIVVVTHGMGTVENMCDQAAWLEHGVVQKLGDARLVASAYLKRVNIREQEEQATRQPTDEPGSDEPSAVKVVGLRFENRDGEDLVAGVTGDPVTIAIDYDAPDLVEKPVFGLAFHSTAGGYVAGVNTKLSEFTIPSISGQGTVRMSMDPLLFNPGEYLISLGIADSHIQHFYVNIYQGWSLRVRAGDQVPGHGLVQLPVKWSATE